MLTYIGRGQFLAVVPWPNAQEIPAQFPQKKEGLTLDSSGGHKPKPGGFHERSSWTREVKPCVLKLAVILHVQMNCRISYI